MPNTSRVHLALEVPVAVTALRINLKGHAGQHLKALAMKIACAKAYLKSQDLNETLLLQAFSCFAGHPGRTLMEQDSCVWVMCHGHIRMHGLKMLQDRQHRLASCKSHS